LRLQTKLTNIKIQENLSGAVIGIWVPLPFVYIRTLYDSLLKNCNCSLQPKIIRPITDIYR